MRTLTLPRTRTLTLTRTLATSHVKVEHVVSGSGIKRAYDFLRVRRDATAELISESAADAAVRDAADPSAVIAAFSVPADAHPADPLCTAAMQMFVDALGAEAAKIFDEARVGALDDFGVAHD